jgi:hypothetical protein
MSGMVLMTPILNLLRRWVAKSDEDCVRQGSDSGSCGVLRAAGISSLKVVTCIDPIRGRLVYEN